MTLPDERYRAIKQTRIFLHELLNPEITPRVPKHIREQAGWCLRHFPSHWEMELAAELAPEVFCKEIEDVKRMFMKYEQSKENENKTSK